MVTRPQRFGVMVMGNLYGDLVSDLGARRRRRHRCHWGINVGSGTAFMNRSTAARESVGMRPGQSFALLPAIDLLEAVGRGCGTNSHGR